jgi:hypothetical protein
MKHMGALISPVDDRDYSVRVQPDMAAPSTWVSPRIPNIGDQKVNNCVNWALSYAQEIVTGRVFSKGYIYGERLETDYQGEGMYPHQAAAAVVRCGNVLLPDWNYEHEVKSAQRKVWDKADVLRPKAGKNKAVQYARLHNMQEVMAARMAGLGVTISVRVESYKTNARGVFKCTSASKGNHAMCILDWSDKFPEPWRVLNSWGTKWGLKGLCYISDEDIWRNNNVYAYEFIENKESPVRRTLRSGMKGDDVKLLQTKLIALGIDLGPWGADGSFGNATKTAVKLFQVRNGLKMDGIVGPATWRVLDNV